MGASRTWKRGGRVTETFNVRSVLWHMQSHTASKDALSNYVWAYMCCIPVAFCVRWVEEQEGGK